MKLNHFFSIVFLTIIWGLNFVAIKFGLQSIPPLEFCCVRFFLVSVPAVFFIKFPSTSLKLVVTYGLVMFALQFSLLFLGMHLGVTAGLASLLFQTQIFFSVVLAVIFLNEQVTIWQILGALVGFSGIVVVGINIQGNATIAGLLLILAAAATWGVGNLISKKIKAKNIFSLIIWGSFVAWPFLLLTSIMFEGIDQIINSFVNYNSTSMAAIIYIVYISTLLGYYIWNWLLNKYPVSVVAPFCLLVPIFGVTSSVILLNEPLEEWKVIASVLVILGLYINTYSSKKSLPKSIQST